MATLIVVLYVIVGACVGVIGTRRYLDIHPTHDDSQYADLATAGFFFLCIAAVWPLILPLVGIGKLVSIGKE